MSFLSDFKWLFLCAQMCQKAFHDLFFWPVYRSFEYFVLVLKRRLIFGHFDQLRKHFLFGHFKKSMSFLQTFFFGLYVQFIAKCEKIMPLLFLILKKVVALGNSVSQIKWYAAYFWIPRGGVSQKFGLVTACTQNLKNFTITFLQGDSISTFFLSRYLTIYKYKINTGCVIKW